MTKRVHKPDEYYLTCSVADWHRISNEKKVALINLEIAKCKAAALEEREEEDKKK